MRPRANLVAMTGGTVIGREGRVRALAALWAVAALAAAALLAPTAGSQAEARGTATLQQIGDFNSPVYVDDAPGAPNLLFVVEQQGRIKVIKGENEKHKPFLDIRDEVNYGGEQGLLSVAFDPDYETNRRFYVYYTTNGGDNRIAELKRSADKATLADPSSLRKVLQISHPSATNHNGGQLQFGPDGYLYAAPGDGGANADKAQNVNSLLGKVLRIDPHPGGGEDYAVPPDNPYVGEAGKDEIYAIGLRNPFRFSFDPTNDAIVIGDVGESDLEEIDYELPADALGANFGWPICEGSACDGPAPPGYQAPLHDYGHTGGRCVVTGGYVIQDPDLAGFAGRYLYADFCEGNLRTIDPDIGSASDGPLGLHADSVSSFGEGAGGQLYVASLDGPVYSIID